MISVASFFDELEKIAFDVDDARRVLRLAKQRTLKVPRVRQATRGVVEAAEAGLPPPRLPLSQAALVQGGGAPMAMSRTGARELSGAVRSGTLGEEAMANLPSVERLQGRILTSARGDATGAIAGHPVLGQGVAPAARALTPQQRMMHNASVMRHEMTEQAIPKTDPTFSVMTGHRGPAAPLSDSNIVATLPTAADRSAVGSVVQGYRPVEGHLLERATRGVGGRPGLEFGERRLSRHARKKVGKRMSELAREDLVAALADEEIGPVIRQQLQAQGVKSLPGAGVI